MKTKLYISILLTLFAFCSCEEKKSKNPSHNYTISELNNSLIKCIETNDYENIENWLSLGADANLQFKDQSLLSYSAYKNFTEVAKILINYGADVNWVDPQDHVSVFSNVIFKNNLELGRYFLAHNVDLTYKDYSDFNYFEESILYKNDEESQFFNDYRFTYLLLKNEIMKRIIREDYGTLYSLIRNWSSEIPSVIEEIYGLDYIFPDDPPVLLISIEENEPDAVRYFVSKGVQISKEYYEPDVKSNYLPEAYALIKYQEIVHNFGENSVEARKMQDIFLLLESKKTES